MHPAHRVLSVLLKVLPHPLQTCLYELWSLCLKEIGVNPFAFNSFVEMPSGSAIRFLQVRVSPIKKPQRAKTRAAHNDFTCQGQRIKLNRVVKNAVPPVTPFGQPSRSLRVAVIECHGPNEIATARLTVERIKINCRAAV